MGHNRIGEQGVHRLYERCEQMTPKQLARNAFVLVIATGASLFMIKNKRTTSGVQTATIISFPKVTVADNSAHERGA